MKRFNQEGLRPRERSDNSNNQTSMDVQRQQIILVEKRNNVRDIADKCQIIMNDIKETLRSIREVAKKFGETDSSLYNQLNYVNTVMSSYQQFANNVRKALNDPSHLERIDWRKTETIAIDHKQQVNQFFNRSLREILQRCYNNGINEYNTISDKLTKNNINQSVFQKILAIENRVAEDKNFVLKNWGSCDLEKRKMRKGAFDLLNRLDQNIIASRYLQQNSYIEYIYPEQENFSFEQNRDIDKEEQLKKLPEGILTKLAKATETSKGSLKNISSTSNTKITEHKQIVLNTQEILLNNVDYPERSKKSIRTAREKNSVRSNISSMSEALENLRRSLHEVKNTHLTEALKEIDTLCASSGETMRADKEPIFGTNDAHSVHM